MSRRSYLAIFVLCMVGSIQAQENVTASKTPLAKLELQTGDSIVFLGDSITHQRLYTQYLEDYFYTRYPKLRLKLHNAGVGGARVWDALQRFDEDVASYKPKYVTILLGMNDGSYRPYDEMTFETYRKDMTELVYRIRAIGATPIMMTPTMYDARAARINPKQSKNAPDNIALYNATLAYFGAWLRETAVEQGCGFVDMWYPLNEVTGEQRKLDPNFTLIKDAVHPDAPGQVFMATAIVDDVGLSRRVSSIKLNPQAPPKRRAIATGGKVTDLKFNDEGCEFTFAAEALPWVLPVDAQLGVQLSKMGHRLGQEALEVHGLRDGLYALMIDGQDVGTFTADALARHIELQGNTKTPQYQQALRVAELNAERQGPIGALRSEWSKFQGYARAKRQVVEHPEDEAAKAQLAKAESSIQGRAERIASANVHAQEVEDRIFAINQPVPRKYSIKRVERP